MAKRREPDHMKEAIARIEKAVEKTQTDISKIGERLGAVDVTLAEQHVTLKEHIARTEIAEANLELVSGRIDPLEKHVSMWAGAGKVLVVLASIATVAGGVFKAVEYWLKYLNG